MQEAGLQLGDCHTWNLFNLKGNCENWAFVDLNGAVLKANGGAWGKSPTSVTWSEQHPELEFQQQLGGVIAGLGLVRPEAEQLFYDSGLKNFDRQSRPRLPLQVWHLYRRLRAISVG
jgi:hypothetical protein